MRLSSLLLLVLLLSSCVPPTPSKPARPELTAVEVQNLRQQWSQVEGVVVVDGEPLRISYPTGVLFSASALLPLPGGVAQLDTLVRNIKSSGRDWQLLVRAQSGESPDYDKTLAAGRVEILRAYLDSEGLSQEQAQLSVADNPGAPLELVLVQ